jgi:hypothetical protein
MEVTWPGGAGQRWVARLGNQVSEPMTLGEAKRAAVAMLREGGKAEPRGWIADLNKIAAAEIDRVALAKDRQQWPCDLLGGSCRGSMQIDRAEIDTILNAELAVPVVGDPLSGDDYSIEYHEDGFPKLPAFLDRRADSPTH